MLFEKTAYENDFPINLRIMKVKEYPIHYHQDIEFIVNGKPHTWSKKVPPFQAASINYSNVFNLQYSGIFSDHGSKSSM